jgi:hypothetical protein
VSRMDEVEPGLWIGDIRAATDGPLLASHSIRSVVSVVRGSVELPAVRPSPPSRRTSCNRADPARAHHRSFRRSSRMSSRSMTMSSQTC